MKTKTIPFDLETAKKIQAGEIQGSIKTKNGNKARILCTDLKNIEYPIAAAITINASSDGHEALETYTRNGFFAADEREHWNNLVLEVPDDEVEELQGKVEAMESYIEAEKACMQEELDEMQEQLKMNAEGFQRLRAELNKAKNPWVSVEERLPEKWKRIKVTQGTGEECYAWVSKTVFVLAEGWEGSPEKAFYDFDANIWWSEYGDNIENLFGVSPDYWMPIPQAPKGGEE